MLTHTPKPTGKLVKKEQATLPVMLDANTFRARLAIDRSICILTRPVVNTGFNRSLLVDWWSIGRLKKTWLM